MPQERNSPTADRELYITKLVNAPVSLVWEVWINPEHIAKWWGPNGFRNTIEKMDMRPGGEWEFVMHGPDGTDYRNKNVFTEIVKEERIVYEHVSAPKHTVTVTFSAQGAQTLITWHMVFPTREDLEQTVRIFKADEGLRQNTERMAAYLASIQAA
ncbi:polyketide cyclase [Chitinophaga agrisoli]|uniref:Polyketide cyclase n=1 Tax=Chitinophaga agrisoli TaxID=2607653 RepID=A0A5B2VVL4_9BACT|nr:SRPBCC family protein [Chitinophaga agrisoli]KAA2243321.1 polyketide cyclase [Chitinophaga agrisoli]